MIDHALLSPEVDLLWQVSADILNNHADINDPANASYQRLSSVLLLEALIASPAAVDNALRLLRSLLLEEDPELARLRGALDAPEVLTEHPRHQAPTDPPTEADMARITRHVDAVVARELGTPGAAYVIDIYKRAEGLMYAVEYMELDHRMAEEHQALYDVAQQLAHPGPATPGSEERIGYALALRVLAEAPEAGCQGLASELLTELRKHDPLVRRFVR